jgi:predicted TIM-barrel fold metal-dependent hydrolase
LGVIIDAHQHVFWHGRDDAGLVADMDEQGIEQAWLLGWEIPPGEDSPGYHRVLTPRGARADGTHGGLLLADVLAARDRYPDRFVAGYCPNPVLPSAPAFLEAAHRIHGVRVCGEWKFRMLLDDPRCLELFRAAGELHMPVVLHLDVPYLPGPDGKCAYQREWYGGTVGNLERALQACGATTFVGHGPGFWRTISGDAEQAAGGYPDGPIVPGGRLIRLLEGYSNLHADLSARSALQALGRDAGHGRGFVERFSDRLLFGRDNYGRELQEFLETLKLSKDVAGRIYCDNARRLLAGDA